MNLIKRILNQPVPRDRFRACHGFFDLDAGSGYEGPMDSVGAMIEAKVMRGDGYGAFRPDDALTFAELAMAICRLAGVPDRATRPLPGDFRWWSGAVANARSLYGGFPEGMEERLADLDHVAACLRAVSPGSADRIDRYVEGRPGGRYVTRAEFCEMAVRTGVLRTEKGRCGQWA